MESERAKKYLEMKDNDLTTANNHASTTIDALPAKFFEPFVLQGLRVDLIEPGRILCTLKVSPRLLNPGNSLHGGATATFVDLVGSAVMYTVGAPMVGVSVEISVSYLDAAYADEEIEIEAKVLRVGKAIGVVNVEFRKKDSGKIIAHGRHTKYLAISSKM